jgi:hypothetical protein
VPITVPPGAVEQWQVQTSLYMPCDVAGAYINSIVWFMWWVQGLQDRRGRCRCGVRYRVALSTAWQAAGSAGACLLGGKIVNPNWESPPAGRPARPCKH